MKHLFRHVMGDVYFTYEELLTILTHSETYLNSHTLTTISSDPNYLIPFISSHFLIENSLTGILKIDETSVPINHLIRWHRVS